MPSPIAAIGTPPALPNIAPLGSVGLPGNPTAPASPTAGPNFANMLSEALESASGLEQSAQNSIEEHLTGGDVTMAETFTEMKKFDLSMRLMIQVRNKLMDAYREIQQLRM